MKNMNNSILVAADNVSQNSAAVNANQLIRASWQFNFGGDVNAAGTLKIQVSNDTFTGIPTPGPFAPTNWSDLTGAAATISSGGTGMILLTELAYQWIRAVWTSTSNYNEETTVTTVADVAGSLNSTYFTFTSKLLDGSSQLYYVWFDNGTGVDPEVADAIGIPVVYVDDDSADTMATLIRAALAAVTEVTVGGTADDVTINNDYPGAVANAANGAASPGFSFIIDNGGMDPGVITVNMNAMSA